MDVVSETVYEFELPLWDTDPGPGYQLYTFDGEGLGVTNGFKGKFDYLGKQWGMAGSLDPDTGEITPTVIWRAAIDPVTHVITLDIVDLPTINGSGDLPIPNQLTVDHDGNIYFPGGPILGFTGQPVLTKGIVTEAPFAIAFTTIAVNVNQSGDIGSYCVTLDAPHNLIITYVVNTVRILDYVVSCAVFPFALSTTKIIIDFKIDNEALQPTGIPYHMECDANPSSPNFQMCYCVIPGTIDAVPGYWCIGFWISNVYLVQSVIIETGDQPVTVDIDEGDLPVYYFTERQDRTPAGNIVNRFNANGFTTMLVELDQRILTQIIKTPTHQDTDRDIATQDFYSGNALNLEPTGFIRRKKTNCTGTEADLATRVDYQKIWVAGRREPRYNST